MKIFIGSDHNGFELKRKLITNLKRSGYHIEDDGPVRLNPSDDFPVFAARVVNNMLSSKEASPMGVLICGSGQGMAMAANRHRGIRAAVCWDREQARVARNDDDANVLALPAHVIDGDLHEALVIVETFLNTPFAAAARFKRRLKDLDQL